MKTRKRLLIIEDNENIIKNYTRFFNWKNYEVLTAPDGLEGLQELKRVNGEVDLILTDLIMPNISGVGIITIAKKKYPDVPIIAITGQGRHAVDLAMESPVDMVLEKPIDLEALDQAIESLILTSVTRKQHQKDISIKQ